ncbi:hypothetical protein [Clostridium sp. JNZ J1-5]
MKNKKVEIILNIIFTSSIVLAIFTMIKTYYIDRRNLPPGACPVANNKPLLYISIGMLVFYIIASTIYEKRIKKNQK